MGGLIAGVLVGYLVTPRERLYSLNDQVGFGVPRAVMRARPQPRSKIFFAIATIVIISWLITTYVSGTYLTDELGNKIPR